MDTTTRSPRVIGHVDAAFSAAERAEMTALGLLDAEGRILEVGKRPRRSNGSSSRRTTS